MHPVPQNFDIPNICIAVGCKSEDTQTVSSVWHENVCHFLSPVVIPLKSSKDKQDSQISSVHL